MTVRSVLVAVGACALAALFWPSSAHAFCGFYVGKADAQLFNDASQVVLVRDGPRTVVTMSNDYKGELKEFALVVPVPTVLTRDQIHVGERKYIERLDAYSGPRLVEYFDSDPCEPPVPSSLAFAAEDSAGRGAGPVGHGALGVTIEAQYTVGEYDILILSAKESGGLETWLRSSGYRIPQRAATALEPYIKQDMKFFVAKVNLKNQAATGFNYLRPLQMAYESKKFMLPIRLGMANGQGSQDLIVYALTKTGRVETTNYRTTRMPSDVNVPVFVKNEFGKVYKAIFEGAYQKEKKRAVFTEYVWNMAWCDPCSAEPLTPEELRNVGVFWLDDNEAQRAAASQVILTRLHVRYDSEHFPEDLVFQQTADQSNFQARYILQHPFKGQSQCSASKQYWESVKARHEQEAKTLADLTGWSLASVAKQMGSDAPPAPEPWYKKLWK